MTTLPELSRRVSEAEGPSRGIIPVSGYASVFGERDLGGDIVMPGAFKRSLNHRRVRMLMMHDQAVDIGMWNSIEEDDVGLFVRGTLDLGEPRAREVCRLIRLGMIDGLSIGYLTQRATRENGTRFLHQVDLWEVSITHFPMLPQARLAPAALLAIHERNKSDE